jgi:hypothetical protein
MFIMYVDDSGDPGANTAVTDKFILSALVIHELNYNTFINDLIVFRKQLRDTKGLKLRTEIHSVEFINKPNAELKKIQRNDRLDILKQCLNWLAARNDISVFCVSVDKSNHLNDDIYSYAWKALSQRFENTIGAKNFLRPETEDSGITDRGIIISDRSDEKKLRSLIREMKKYNPVTSRRDLFSDTYRNLQLKYIIEDPNFRDSDQSYILQMVDVCAYFLMQKKRPNSYVRKKGATLYFDRLQPVLHPKITRNGSGVLEI